MQNNSWIVCALLSAIFASLTSILAKVGIGNMNSNLATAIRTIVVLVMAWGMVFITGAQKEISTLTPKSLTFLIISGIATGLSWLFYYRAVQIGPVSKVAPIDKLSIVFTMIMAFIFLGEQITIKTVIGGILITLGTLVMVL